MRRALAFAALTAALVVGPEARAQARSAGDAAARTVAHQIISAGNLTEMIMEGAQRSSGELAGLGKIRPEWPQMIMDSVREEVTADGPTFEAILARTFSKAFTAEELEAGAVILSDPALQAVLAAGARHETPPPPRNPPCGSDCVRALGSPPGRAFFAKMKNVQSLLGPDVVNDFAAAVLPGAMTRFGARAAAAERARGN